MRSKLIYVFILVLTFVGIFLGAVAAAHAAEKPADIGAGVLPKGAFTIADAQEIIRETLINRGLEENLALEYLQVVPDGKTTPIPLEKAEAAGINYPLILKDIVLQENIARFTATLERVEDIDKPLPDTALVRPSLPGGAIEIRGRYIEMREIPTVTGRMRKGDIITAKDVDYISVPKSRVRSTVIADESNLIGKAVRRTLDAGDIIRVSDVEAPKLVERGKLIAIFYRTGAMELRDMGYAQADGADGDVIQVKNARSNVVVQARVVAPNTAVVNYWQQQQAFNQQASN